MKKYAVVLAVVVVLFIFAYVVGVFSNDIVWDDIGRGNLNLRTALSNPDNPKTIYIGSSSGVFKTEDGGLNWRNILSIRGQNKAVNFLLFDPKNNNSVYAATGNGLFLSTNQGKDWKRIFQGKNYLENECLALAILPAAIYLGTKSGLFVSKDNGRSWHKEIGKIGNAHILSIAYSFKESSHIYVAGINGVFKTEDAGKSWERILVSHPKELDNDMEEITDDRDEEERSSDIRYITIDPNNLNYLYLATSRGVYKSRDRGTTWQLIPSYGLLDREVKFLLLSRQSHLYAVTKSGVFEYSNDRWQELSLHFLAEEVRFLSSDSQDNLYAACDKGLFKARITDLGETKISDNIISVYYKDEPEIKQVQQAAIKYAEVEPEKILRWRKQAAKKAILPKISIGMDQDLDRTTSSNIWGIYSSNGTPGRYYAGPDDIAKYNNKSWSVSLTWELGDLIWNDDQTNIDVRSKLMVQLRDDVLDEVTKLYFERIRVKMELDNLSIEDRKKRFEKELKLQELTAQIDGLTGGYFSSQIQ